MSIYNISISHKTAPIEIRELLAFSKEEKIEFLKKAVELEDILECVLITTCNRTEVYMNGGDNTLEQMIHFIVQVKNLSYEKLLKYFQRYSGEKAVRHLFQMTSGIDSMLIGEDEILGQVKDDFQLAIDTNTTESLLNTLFRDAITCAKKVKTDTMISKTPVSIGTLAANKIFQFSKKEEVKKVLIIGLTGKFGTILMKNLYHNKKVLITGTTRTHNLTEDVIMGYPEVHLIDYHKRYEKMNEVDIIVSATTSPHYTITYDELVKNLIDKKPRLFIDLSVPMDIDEDILKIENTRIINIDYFKQLSEDNNSLKLKEVEFANLIIDQEVDEFLKWINFRDFIPNIEKLKKVFETQSFENIIYQMRNSVSSKDLEVILSSFEKLLG